MLRRTQSGRCSSILERLPSVASRYRSTIIAAGIVVAASTILLGAVLIQNSRQPDGRIVIGNTAGSLTTVIEIADSRIVVGAGPTRSHSADLIGRSTVPWDRTIDLLILPGWDEYHVAGAMGLLERRDVRGIAVVGLPGEAPIWTLLEREAQRQDVPIRFLERAHQLWLDDDSDLWLDSGGGNDAGAFVRLSYRGARIVIQDGLLSGGHSVGQETDRKRHLFIASRTGLAHVAESPVVLVQPEPFVSREFDEPLADYLAEIPRNERVVIRLIGDEIRIPLDDLQI